MIGQKGNSLGQSYSCSSDNERRVHSYDELKEIKIRDKEIKKKMLVSKVTIHTYIMAIGTPKSRNSNV